MLLTERAQKRTLPIRTDDTLVSKELLAALEVEVFVFILWCCAFVFLGQKYVPAASPPDSPQGPGVRHLVTSPNSQGTKP